MIPSKRSNAVLLAACLVLCAAPALHAQSAVVVDLDVACDDTALRTLIRGFFSRELRDLGDVGIAQTSNPDYGIEAIAVKEGRSWVMSVVITGATLEMPETKSVLVHALERGDSTEDLDRIIGLMVRDLDREVLKPIRKARKKKG